MPRIDAHLHVFTKASSEFPREISDIWPAEREEPVEKLLDQMEKHQIDQAVLVQMAGASIANHRYLLRCLKDYPNRFLGIGLVPEGHPNPAEHMAELTDNTGIIGFRFLHLGDRVIFLQRWMSASSQRIRFGSVPPSVIMCSGSIRMRSTRISSPT